MMKKKRIGALLLSVMLAVTQLPAVAMAENYVPEDGSIASFTALPSGVAEQIVTVGTAYEDLVLPDMVEANVYHVTEDMIIPDEDEFEEEIGGASTASPSDAGKSTPGNDAGHKTGEKTTSTVTTTRSEIFVTWDSDPAYDGGVAGSYVFTPDVGGYVLADGAKLPRITVTVSADTVENPAESPNGKPTGEPLPCALTGSCTLPDGHEGECVPAFPADDALIKTVTNWTFVDDENLTGGELVLPGVSMDNQADFDTVVSMLPTQISAVIDKVNGGEADKEDGLDRGETNPVILDISGWSCPEYIQDNNGN